MTETLKEEFQKAMFGIYTRTYSAGRFSEMVNTRGGLETAKTLLREEEPRAGFVALHEQGRLYVTMEAEIVEHEEWHPLFTQEEIGIARKRLFNVGH